MDQAMATQQIPVSPPWYLFLGKPSESGVWLTGNVVLVAPILLLVHCHPSAETTSCLSHVFTIPVLYGHFRPFTHPLCASGSQGPPRKSWESLPLPRLGYLLLHQNGMKTSEEALTVLSHKSSGLSNNSSSLFHHRGSELGHADMQKERSSKGGTACPEAPVLSSISKLSQTQHALQQCPISFLGNCCL